MMLLEEDGLYSICIECKNKIKVFDKIKSDETSKDSLDEDSLDYLNSYIIVNNIKKIRTDANIDQNELAHCIDMFPQRYGNIERNDNIPSIITITSIALTLGVSYNDIYKPINTTKEQYDKMKYLTIKQLPGDKFIIKEDLKIKEMELAIEKYEEEVGFNDRRIFNNSLNIDDEKTVQIKKNLQKMDKDFTDYKKKVCTVLKRGRIIDYYHWQEVKKIINFKE